MSEDLDRGIDELVNEAMHVFAREKGYLPTENESPRQSPSKATGSGARKPPPPPPPPASFRGAAAAAARASAPELPQPVRAAGTGLQPTEEAGNAPPLYLLFQSQKYLIDKEQFIIGRGSKSSDLPIRDGNISRKHAAVIRRNGSYYIKDLGSTNGIDYNGVRIDNKRIDEGDVYSICDYELRFTFR